MASRISKTSARATAAGDAALRSWLLVVRACHLCDAVMARRLGDLGVRTPEHEILANLLRDPGITQQVLAKRCFSAKSHISALLGSLEERAWVRREADPADARAKRLFLAPEGERMAALTGAVQADVVAAMAAAVDPAAMLQVTLAMQQVGERLSQMLDE